MSCTSAVHVPIVLIMALRSSMIVALGAPFPAPRAARSHPSVVHTLDVDTTAI
jgi:hypothetical protein